MLNQQKRPTNLPLHNFPIESFIGGTYMPEKVCDDLIDFFESNPERQTQGKVNANPNEDLENLQQERNLVKKSIDMGFDIPNNPEDCEVMNEYFKYLNMGIAEYQHDYPVVKNLERFGTIEGVNIQKYNPGDGFYEWHQERNGWPTASRCLVHMTYLNDVPDGGTNFYFQKLTTPAKKGLTVIWPSDWTHIHQGQVSKTHTKYIVTGWMNYLEAAKFYG